MDILQVILKLKEMNFEIKPIEEFFGKEFIFFQKEHINIVYRHYDQEVNLELISKETKEIRNIMHKNNYNAWNSYFLIGCNIEVTHQDVFAIERSSDSLRKYFIQNASDFNRILFLDSTKTFDLIDILEESRLKENIQFKKIKDFIEFNHGASQLLSKQTIRENIKNILELEG